jgi:hypothetical protein
MAQTIAIAVLAAVYFLIRYLNRTDIPKIKGLPEIPGVPVFGNLLQLGDHCCRQMGQKVRSCLPSAHGQQG